MPVVCASDGGLAVYLAHQWSILAERFRPTALTYREDLVDTLWKDVGIGYRQVLDVDDRESIVSMVQAACDLDSTVALLHLAQRSKVFTSFYSELMAGMREAGMGICAVLHEVMPFSDQGVSMDRLCSQYALLDTVLVASEREKSRLRAFSGIPAERIRVAKHPAYHLLARNTVTRDAARASLGLARDQRMLLNFGMARAGKGVSLLVRAFREVRRRHPGTRLVCHTNLEHHRVESWHAEDARITAGCSDVERITRHLGTDEIETLFRACDLVVLPYLEGIQSGVYNLARAYAKPVFISEVMVEEGDLRLPADQVFRTGDESDLAAKLSALLELPADELARRGMMSARLADPRDDWRYNGRMACEALEHAARIAASRRGEDVRSHATG